MRDPNVTWRTLLCAFVVRDADALQLAPRQSRENVAELIASLRGWLGRGGFEPSGFNRDVLDLMAATVTPEGASR